MPRIIDLGPPYGPTSFADDASDADIVAQYDSLEAERAKSLKLAKMVGVRLADLAEEEKPTLGKVITRAGLALGENAVGATKQAVGGLARNIGQFGDIPLLTEAGKDIADEGDAQLRSAAEMGQRIGGGVLAASAESLAGSLGGSAPMLLAGPLGRTAMAGATAFQTFGPTQSQFRDRLMQLNPDLTEQEAFDQARLPAGLNAVASGLLTRAFGGVEKYIGRIAEEGLSKAAATSLLRDAWKASLGEFPEEYGQQLVQGLIEKASIDRNKPIGEIFNDAGMAGLQGAVLGAGTVGGIGGVARAADAISGRIGNAVEESRVRRQSTRESRARIAAIVNPAESSGAETAAGERSTAEPEIAAPATPAPGAPATDIQESKTAPAQTESPEFMAWFGGSKVVDKEGKPLRVYHGTDQDFTVFKSSKWGAFGEGIYFTDDPTVASNFAQGIRADNKTAKAEGNVKPVYAKIELPFDDAFLSSAENWKTYIKDEILAYYAKSGIHGSDSKAHALYAIGKINDGTITVGDLFTYKPPGESYTSEAQWSDKLNKVIKDSGFDGIVGTTGKGYKEIVVFKPEQIKSAIGNSGAFDPNSPNIVESKTPVISGRSPEVQQALQDLMAGKITRAEYDATVQQFRPIAPLTEMPTPATYEQMLDAVYGVKAPSKPLVGKGGTIAPGTQVGLRADLPWKQKTGKTAVVVHAKDSGSKPGTVLSFESTGRIANPKFIGSQTAAAKIGQGEARTPFAAVFGEWSADQSIPSDVMTWTQVGFDPTRHSYYYDKATMNPVIGGVEAIQIGGTIFVREPAFGSIDQTLYSRGGQTGGAAALPAQSVARHLADTHGAQPDGVIQVVTDPSANFDGRIIFDKDTGKLVRIEINSAKVTSTQQVDAAVEHEIAHIVWRDGEANAILATLSEADRAAIDTEVTRLGYSPENANEESGARGIAELAKAWKARGWFKQIVGKVLAWANSYGLRMTRLAAERIAARVIANTKAAVVQGQATQTTQNPDIQQSVTPIKAEQVAGGVAQVGRIAEEIYAQRELAAQELEGLAYERKQYKTARTELKRLANIAYGRFGASAQLAPGAMVPDFSKGVSINEESGEIEVDSTFTDALDEVDIPHNPSVVQHMQAELFFEGAARRLNNILAQIETLKSAKDHYVLLNAAPSEISIIDKSINKLQTQASKLDDATNGGDTVGGRASEMRANAEMRPARMAQRDSLALEPVAEFFGKNVGKYRSFLERAESARALTQALLDAATDPAEITRLTADVSSWANLPADIRTAIKFGHPLTEEQRKTVFATLSMVFGEFDIVRARMNEIRAARLPVIAKEEKELIKQAREFSIKSGTEEVMIYDVLATLDGGTGGTGSIQGQAVAQQLKLQASAIQTFALNLGNSLETNWSLFEWLANPTISGGPAMFSVQGFNIDSQTLAMILDEVKRNPAFGSAIVSLVASSQKKLKNMPVVQLEALEKLVSEGKIEEAQALSNKLMERANANASVAESSLSETLRKLDALNIERMSLDSGAAMFTELEESPEFRETRDLVANSAYGHLMEMVLQNNTTTTFLPFGTKEMGEGKWHKGLEMDASASPVLQSGWHLAAIAYYQNAQRYLDAYGEAEKQHLEDPTKPQPSDLGFDLAKVRGLQDATERMMRGMFMEVSLMSENKRWKVPRLNRWLSKSAWFRQHDQVAQMVGGQPGTELRIKLGDFINHHLIGKSIDQRFSDLPILRNKAMKSHPEVQMNFANYREIWNEMSHWGRLQGSPVRAGFPLLISGTVVTAEDVALLKREVQYEEELRRKVTETNTVSGVRYKLGDREYVRPGAYVGDEGLPRHLGLQSNTFIADILAAYGDGRTPISSSTDLSASSADPMVAFWNKNLKDLKQHVLDVRREDRSMVIDPVMDRAEKNTEADWRLNGTPAIQSVEDLVNALVAHAPAMTGVNVRDRIVAGLNTELRQYRDAAKRIENDRAERDKSRNTGASIALSADNEFTKPAAKLELPSRYYNYGALTDSEHLTASSRANHERVVAYAVAVNRAIANLQGRVSRYEAPGTGISASEAASSYGGDIEEMKQVLGLLKLVAADFEAAYGMGSANATKKGFFSDFFGLLTSAVLAGPTVGIRNMSSGQLEVFAMSRAMGLGGYRMTMGLAMKNAVRALSRFALSAADHIAIRSDLGIATITGTDRKVFSKLVDAMAILLMQPDYRASAARVHELGYDTRDSLIARYQRIWQETEESANREELDASKISILGQERQLSKLAGLPVKLLRATFDKVGVQQYDQALNSSLLGYAHLLERRLKEVAINYGEAREAEGLGEFNLADKRWTLKPHEWAAFKGFKAAQQNDDSLARFRILLESSAAAEGFQLEQNLWEYYQEIKEGKSPAMFTGPQFDSIQRKLVADFNASTPANRSSASAGDPWKRNILTLQGYGSDLLLKLINSTGGVRDRAAAASLLTKIPIISSLAVTAVALGYMALSATGEWDRRLRGKMPTLPTPLDKDFWTNWNRWYTGTLRMGAAQIPYLGDILLGFMGQTQGNKGFDPIGRIWPISVAQGLWSAVTGSWKTYKGAGSLTDSVKPMLDFGRKIGPYWLEVENAFGQAQGSIKQGERVIRGEASNLDLLPESRGGAGVSYGPTTIVRRNLAEAVSAYHESTQSGDAEGAAAALATAKAEMAKLEAFYTKKYLDAKDTPEKAKEKAVRDVWNDYQEINPVVSAMLGKRPTQAQFDLIRAGTTGERGAVVDTAVKAWQAGAQALFNRPGSITREDVSGNRAGLGSAGTGLPTLPRLPGSTVRRSSGSGYLRQQGSAPSIPQGSAYRPSRRRMRSTISRRRSVRRVSRKMPKITRKRPTLGSRVRRSYASA